MLSIPSLQGRPRSYIPYSQLLSLFTFAYLDCDGQELTCPKICRGSFSVDSDHSPGVINLPGIRLLESRTVLHLDPMIHAILLRRCSGCPTGFKFSRMNINKKRPCSIRTDELIGPSPQGILQVAER